MAFINLNSELVAASDKWFALFNLPPDKSVGKTIDDLHGDNANTWYGLIAKCLKNPQEYRYKGKLQVADHDIVCEWSLHPWYNERENFIGVIIKVQDKTERYQLLKKLKKVEFLLSSTSEIANVGTWEFNINQNKIFWSSITKKIHGVAESFTPTIEKVTNFYQVGHSRNSFSMFIFKAIEKGQPFYEKLKIVDETGTEKWVMVGGKPIYKEDKIVKLFGTIQDISKGESSIEIIKDKERLLKTLINNLPLLVFIKDTTLQKTLVNKAECEYLDIEKPEEIIGKTDFDLYDPQFAANNHVEELTVMKTLQPVIAKETQYIKKNGEKRHFLTSKIPFLDVNGKAKGVIGIGMDISALKQKEYELTKLIDVTSVQNKKLIHYAHIISHNLRSHTANFSMLLGLLKQEKSEDEKEKMLEMLFKVSDNLTETIVNLNSIIQINTEINIEKKSVNLYKCILDVKSNLSTFLKKSNTSVIANVPLSLRTTVVPEYLESILLNLFTNAVKYKHPDRDPIINIKAKKIGNKTIINISDNGLGIDIKKHQHKLFGMYKTFHNNKDARGIGLYITKNHIDIMGGHIIMSSEVEIGSTFTIYLYERK